MNEDTIKANWKEFKGKAKVRWGKLTNDRLDVIDGKRDQLAGEIQHAYGVSREKAEEQIRAFEKTQTRD